MQAFGLCRLPGKPVACNSKLLSAIFVYSGVQWPILSGISSHWFGRLGFPGSPQLCLTLQAPSQDAQAGPSLMKTFEARCPQRSTSNCKHADCFTEAGVAMANTPIVDALLMGFCQKKGTSQGSQVAKLNILRLRLAGCM